MIKKSISSSWAVFYVSIILGFIFIMGASKCKFKWEPYSSKADCMTHVFNQVDDKRTVIDLDYVAKVEDYCKSYDSE